MCTYTLVMDLKAHTSVGKLAVVGIEKLKHTHKLIGKFAIGFTLHTQAASPLSLEMSKNISDA